MNLQLVPILGSHSCQHNQLVMIPQAKLACFFVLFKKKTQTEAPNCPFPEHPQSICVGSQGYVTRTACLQPWQHGGSCQLLVCSVSLGGTLPSQHHLGSAHHRVRSVPSSPFLLSVRRCSRTMQSVWIHLVTSRTDCPTEAGHSGVCFLEPSEVNQLNFSPP